jgi:hypothetical protein
VRPDVLVLPSPLLPPTAYSGLVAALRRRGLGCCLATSTSVSSASHLLGDWSGQATSRTHFIAHSNAGYLAPTVRQAIGADTRIIFLDAALPPLTGDTALAPRPLRHHLATMVDERGLLPPWTRWWQPQEMATTIPASQFAALDASCPQLPLCYFDERIHAPDGWARQRNAYLAFGDTYADEVALARDLSWPLELLHGGHLAFLWDVEPVVNAVERLFHASSGGAG